MPRLYTNLLVRSIRDEERSLIILTPACSAACQWSRRWWRAPPSPPCPPCCKRDAYYNQWYKTFLGCNQPLWHTKLDVHLIVIIPCLAWPAWPTHKTYTWLENACQVQHLAQCSKIVNYIPNFYIIGTWWEGFRDSPNFSTLGAIWKQKDYFK
jgi:hypothetical protein